MLPQKMFPQAPRLDPRAGTAAEFTHHLVEALFVETLPIAIGLLAGRVATQRPEVHAEYTPGNNGNVRYFSHPPLGRLVFEAE